MHAGSAIVSASLSRRFCILNSRRTIRTIVRSCIKCRKVAARPNPQLFGQIPADHLNPGLTFDCVGVDYAGPMLIKSGPILKQVSKNAYETVFVCFAAKAVHLELVSKLTTAAFIDSFGAEESPGKFGAITVQILRVPNGKLMSYYKEKVQRE